jgi:vacuolar-type H+-ATPase subunit E/Vma4
MNDSANIPPAGENDQKPQDAWEDVGHQFQALGASLAQAVRSAWNDEDNRRRVQEMQSGLEAMVREVGDAISDTASSPQGQSLQQDAKRTAENLVDAGEKTVQEVRPHLMRALEQLNGELQKLVDRMNKGSGSGG